MMGVFRGSSKALVFVIDTTQSMSDDLQAVKAATETLVTGREGTTNEPSVYILVPFSDPGRTAPACLLLVLSDVWSLLWYVFVVI